MSERYVYVVVCYWGEYDDYTESVERAFFREEDAERYIEKQDRKNVKYRIDKTPIDEATK